LGPLYLATGIGFAWGWVVFFFCAERLPVKSKADVKSTASLLVMTIP